MKFLSRCCRSVLLLGIIVCGVHGPHYAGLAAQEAANASSGPETGFSQEELRSLAAQSAKEQKRAEVADPTDLTRGSINFLNLLLEGGVLMVPIGLMSLLVVTVALERMFALRSARVFPRGLRRELVRMVDENGVASPQTLYEFSLRYPSAASRMLQDVLQKVGRPIPEIETVISEGVEREADAMYGHVRWLTLAAAVTPLIGLLGTVWGMIIAFYNTTQLGAGSNRAETLAEGIYVALVTTLGGLAVAIPAAILAHYFEGRITKMLSAVEQALRRLVPRFESLEGKARYDIGSRGMTRRLLSESPTRRMNAELSSPKQVSLPSTTAQA